MKINNKGNSLVEHIMFMTFLILLGVVIYTLIFSGVNTKDRILQQKNAQINARIALSHVDVILRQNDIRNKIEIKPNEINGQNSIVIKERGEFENYDIWIYWADGLLKQEITNVGEQPLQSDFNEIANIYGFDIKIYENGVVNTYVTYKYNGKTKSMLSKTYLRSY